MKSCFPEPLINERTRSYWEGALAKQLMAYQCDICGRLSLPADYECPNCHKRQGAWSSVSGRGWIHSFCTFHKAYWPETKTRLPYTVIQVRLEENLFVYSRLIGKTPPRIGMSVKVRFDESKQGLTLAFFEPCGSES